MGKPGNWDAQVVYHPEPAVAAEAPDDVPIAAAVLISDLEDGVLIPKG
jgi:hypothetical protein